MPVFDSKHTDWLDHIWFDATKWTGITASLDCTFEAYPGDEELFTGTYTPGIEPITADLACAFFSYENETDLFQARNLGELTGALSCTFSAYPVDIEIFAGTTEGQDLTGNITCSFETWVMQAQTGLHMGLAFQPWTFNSSFFVEGEEMDNIVFKPFDFFATGTNQYNQLTVSFAGLDGEMYAGSGLNLVGEDFSMEGIAIIGHTGSIDMVMQRFTFFGDSGGPTNMSIEFEEFDFSAMSYTEYLATLNLVMRRFDLVMAGDTPILATLDGRFMRFSVTFNSGAVQSIVATLNLDFQPFWYIMGGIKGISADLIAQLEEIKMEMNAFQDGPNSIDLVFKPPEMYVSFDDEDCDLAETLTY